MKLLSKQEIFRQRSAERKLDIDEGVKLARKIDTLRETSAVEEARLAKFKEEAIKFTKIEIAKLVAKKRQLEAEITTLKAQKRAEMAPLDAEWELVTKRAKELKKQMNLLEKAEITLQNKQTIFEEQRKLLEMQKNEIDDEKHRIIALEEEAEARLEITGRGLAEAVLKDKEITKYLDEKERSIITRESQLAMKERDFVLKEELYAQNMKELGYKERQIADKYETLQRTINRLK